MCGYSKDAYTCMDRKTCRFSCKVAVNVVHSKLKLNKFSYNSPVPFFMKICFTDSHIVISVQLDGRTDQF